MNNWYRIVLTGGPGGGITTLIKELLCTPVWSDRIAVLPEAVSMMQQINISAEKQLFQRIVVHFQIALEDGLACALDSKESRTILCHRGSLDPLAYWLDCGWPQDEFFEFTGTRLEEHYSRYDAVIHLVTAADGASEYYTRWPNSHRTESIEQAIQLDLLLHQVWSGHPRYFHLDNNNRSWTEKAQEAKAILETLMGVARESNIPGGNRGIVNG